MNKIVLGILILIVALGVYTKFMQGRVASMASGAKDSKEVSTQEDADLKSAPHNNYNTSRSNKRRPVVGDTNLNNITEVNNNNKKENMQEENQNITKATFKTNQGDITIEFYNADAPNTVANFIKLAKSDFYNGVKFHRVIKGFMIQGGDPLSKEEGAAWGTGGPGYQFADEIHANNKNNKYTLAMANSGPNTNGSQFFINTADNNFLDPKHTVFGKVVAGTDVIDKIENTATGTADRPLEPMVIESIVLE